MLKQSRMAAALQAALLIHLATGVCLTGQAQSSSDSSGRLRVPSQIMAGQLLTMVSPHYPQLAGKQDKPATVMVQVAISPQGTVIPLRVLSGPATLGTEAMNAVRLWRYRPYLREGVPIAVTTEVSVTFTPGKAAGLVTHPTG
jgi:TonB family protein